MIRNLALALALVTIGCAASGDDTLDPSGGDDEGDSHGNGSGNGTGSGQGGDPGLGAGSGSGGSTGAGFEECAQASLQASLTPVSMLIAFDKSLSMLDGNKWNSAQSAFVSFFEDPAADALSVALGFWPDGNCNELSCDKAACAVPSVDVGPLSDPAQEQALVGSFASHSPFGLTPMSAALAGATQWATAHQAEVQGKEKVVVVFVTDGEPTACEIGIAAISGYAASAYADAGVMTFAVGLQGSAEAQLDKIAQAGNTQKAFFIGNGNAEADLLAALKAIQQSTVECSFPMPDAPDPNTPIDSSKVNVTFEGQPIPHVADNGCQNGGWFYDDPANPTSIQLCQSTCDAIQGEATGEIEIVLGCETIVQ